MTLSERLERVRHDFLYDRVFRLPHVDFAANDRSPLLARRTELFMALPCYQEDEYRAVEAALEAEGRWPWHRTLRHCVLFPDSYLYRWHPRRLRHYWGRLRYGVGHEDAGDGGAYLAGVIARAARDLLAFGQTYPGVTPWETPERWHDDLETLATGCEHWRDGCNPYTCPAVQRALTLLPEMLPCLSD